jgi:hypothetical protein
LVHATAVWALVRQLRIWGLPPAQRLLTGLAVGLGCTPMDHIQTLSTDALAASLGVGVVAALLRWARSGGSLLQALPVAVLTTVTVFVRPAYLYLIPWLLVAGAMLLILLGHPGRRGCLISLVPTGLAALAVLAWMTVRLLTVGEFAVVPFGHQNLAGVLVQLVSDAELSQLDGAAGPLARQLLRAKQDYLDSGGEFEAGPPAATMTIDARWDVVTYSVVQKAARSLAGEDNVARHRLIRDLNRALIRRYPGRYVKWIAKAIRRGAWAIAADIVMHPIFLAAIILAIGIVLCRAVWMPTPAPTAPPSLGLRALTVITWTYLVLGLAFIALTSPPIGRFADAAAIFLPGWLAATCWHHWFGRAECSGP